MTGRGTLSVTAEDLKIAALTDALKDIRDLASNVDDHWGANPWENLDKIKKIADTFLWPR